jgi:membrane protease YdiL (CAAX protease family)
MEKEIKRLFFLISLAIIFICGLNSANIFSGITKDILSVFAYILPITVFYIYSLKYEEEIRVDKSCFMIKKEGLKLLLLIPIALALIALASVITNTLLSYILPPKDSVLDGNIVWLIIKHALLVSLLEEILFRLIPLKLIADMGIKKYILISSLLFMLIHSIYSMPYALVAGIVLGYITYKTKSIFISSIIHFINNIIGVLIAYKGGIDGLFDVYLYTLLALSVVSVIALFLVKKTNKCK